MPMPVVPILFAKQDGGRFAKGLAEKIFAQDCDEFLNVLSSS
jgi:hypothetical protein